MVYSASPTAQGEGAGLPPFGFNMQGPGGLHIEMGNCRWKSGNKRRGLSHCWAAFCPNRLNAPPAPISRAASLKAPPRHQIDRTLRVTFFHAHPPPQLKCSWWSQPQPSNSVLSGKATTPHPKDLWTQRNKARQARCRKTDENRNGRIPRSKPVL